MAVDFAVADGDALPNRARAVYDPVAAIFIQFADPAMRQRLFANMLRACVPAALLVLQGYTPRQLQYHSGGPQHRPPLHRGDAARGAFAAAEIVELRSYDAEAARRHAHRHGRTRRHGGAQTLSRSARGAQLDAAVKATPAAMLAHQPVASASARDAAGLPNRSAPEAALTSR